jgi:predicted RNA-binding Zn-ribbon protein involved in translation (DUF1610 family)
MKVVIEYIYNTKRAKECGQNGHHYIREFKKCNYYCPVCGKQEVWNRQDGGDYYMGESYYCTNCGATSYLDNTSVEEQNDDIIEQLKTGVTKTPTTPKGN